jgi:hypothetical protein
MTRNTERCGRPCIDGHPCRAISAKHGRGCALHYRQPPAHEGDTMTSSIEKHEQLIAAGWRSRLDGKWISPDPNEARYAFTFAAAWAQHEQDQQVGNRDDR